MSGQFSGQVPNQSGISLSSMPPQQNMMQISGGQLNTLKMDHHMLSGRRFMQERIYAYLMRRLQTKEFDPKKMMDIARRLEEELFKTATSKEEYINLETLENRLLVLMKRIHFSYHNQQYQQQGNTSSVPMGTMIPTPGMPQTPGGPPPQPVGPAPRPEAPTSEHQLIQIIQEQSRLIEAQSRVIESLGQQLTQVARGQARLGRTLDWLVQVQVQQATHDRTNVLPPLPSSPEPEHYGDPDPTTQQ